MATKKIALSELIERAEHNMLKASNDIISEAARELETTSAVKGRLPERLFKSDFLPYFSGERPITERENFFGTWVSIAGSPGSDVELIDDTGKVTVTVPALIDTTCLNISPTSRKNSIGEMVSSYNDRMNNLPALGRQYLNQSMPERLGRLIDENAREVKTKVGPRWKAVFDHFGVKSDSQNSQSSSSNKSNSEDVFEDM